MNRLMRVWWLAIVLGGVAALIAQQAPDANYVNVQDVLMSLGSRVAQLDKAQARVADLEKRLAQLVEKCAPPPAATGKKE
jgi:hypothetical protein